MNAEETPSEDRWGTIPYEALPPVEKLRIKTQALPNYDASLWERNRVEHLAEQLQEAMRAGEATEALRQELLECRPAVEAAIRRYAEAVDAYFEFVQDLGEGRVQGSGT